MVSWSIAAGGPVAGGGTLTFQGPAGTCAGTWASAAGSALADVDVVLFVIEADRFGGKDKVVLDLLPQDKPVILVVNKTDRLKDKAAFRHKLYGLREE